MLFFRSHWNSKYFSSKTEQRFLWPLLQIIIPCDRVLKLWLAIFDALLALTMARLQILANFFERITFRRTDNWFLWTDNFWFTPFKSTFQAEIRQINIGYSWSRGIYSEPKKIGSKAAMVANSGALKVGLLKSLFTYSFFFYHFWS